MNTVTAVRGTVDGLKQWMRQWQPFVVVVMMHL
jgi:hypothetical protein